MADSRSDSSVASADEIETKAVPEPGTAHTPVPSGTGASVGRYVVLEAIGRGAMGRVLRAYDPKLQREVALKLVATEDLEIDSRERMLREARAMAKLSHPNVVSVYDAEDLGDEGVVLIMEYVAGHTLRDEAKGAARSWSAIIGQFLAAGRGLTAAHAAGVLHRDFKPANVMVGSDGSVKVTDFGLAKTDQTLGRQSAADSLEAEPRRGDDLTEIGTVMGTPRYMAPEQHQGRALTPAADQYAFCVALWEALCGAPPFAGDGLGEQKAAGPPSWPAPGSGVSDDVPRPITHAIVRGLAPDPDDRWASMDALLEALRKDTGRQRRRWVLGLGGIGLATVAAASLQSWASARTQRCSGAADQLVGTWDEARRDAVRAAMLGIDRSFATRAWERTRDGLDRYAEAWAGGHADACEATTLRGEQSADVMDLRMACLHRARMNLEAVTDVLSTANAEVVRNAHELVEGLPRLDRCADVEALQAEVEPPRPEDADAVDELRALLAESEAERKAGRYADAHERVAAARHRLDELDYGPAVAEVALEEGRVLQELGDYSAADAVLREALASASNWQQAEVMGDAAFELIFAVGAHGAKMDEALHYRELARGLAHGDLQREADVIHAVASVLNAQGHFAEAEAEFRRALELRTSVLEPDHPDLAWSHNNLGSVLYELGKYEEGQAHIHEAMAIQERSLGLDHPDVAATRSNLCNVLRIRGAFAEAEAECRRALDVVLDALGPEHPEAGRARVQVAIILELEGRYAEAETEMRQALAVQEVALGPEHHEIARTHFNLGNILQEQGKFVDAETEHRKSLALQQSALGSNHADTAGSVIALAQDLAAQQRYDQAEAEYRRGVALVEETLGPEHGDAAWARGSLGSLLYEQGRYAEAEAEHRQALAVWEASLGSGHPFVAWAEANVVQALLEQGKLDEVRALAEQAWAIARRDDVPPVGRGQAAFVLARALWATARDRSDRTQAIEMARTSREAYERAGEGSARESTLVRRWLATHSLD